MRTNSFRCPPAPNRRRGELFSSLNRKEKKALQAPKTESSESLERRLEDVGAAVQELRGRGKLAERKGEAKAEVRKTNSLKQKRSLNIFYSKPLNLSLFDASNVQMLRPLR